MDLSSWVRKLQKNLDIYAAVVVAFVATIYAALAPDSRFTGAMTLACLTVLLTAVIGMRFRFEALMAAQQTEAIFWSLPENLWQRMADAKEIFISGMHRNEFLLANKNKISEGKKIRILIVDPDGQAIQMAAKRFSCEYDPQDTVAREKQNIRQSIALIKNLKQTHKDLDIELRTIDFLLSFGVILLNPESPHNSAVFIEHYTFRNRGGRGRPKTEYGPGQEWHKWCCEEAKELWKEGTPVALLQPLSSTSVSPALSSPSVSPSSVSPTLSSPSAIPETT